MARTVTGDFATVAAELIKQALTGTLTPGPGMAHTENLAYQKRCEVFHEGSRTIVALTRDNLMGLCAWHVSMSFRDAHNQIAPFDTQVADVWIKAIFGTAAGRVIRLPAITSPNIAHFILSCPGGFIELPERVASA